MRVFLVTVVLTWALAGCKSSSGFSGGARRTTEPETSTKTEAHATARTTTRTSSGTSTGSYGGYGTDGATDTGTTNATATETSYATDRYTSPPPASPAVDYPSEVDGHKTASTCDQCLQLAIQLSQAEGFTATRDAIHNYGAGIFAQYPALCDVHWLNPSGGPQEVFTACDCSCF